MQERVRAEWREQYDPNNELSLDELRQKVRDEFTSQARSQLAKEIGEEEVNVMDVQNVMEQMQQRNREMFKVRQLTSRSADTSRARPIPATPSLLLACITCSPRGAGRSNPRSAGAAVHSLRRTRLLDPRRHRAIRQRGLLNRL